MGLLTSVNNINYNLQAKEKEKRKREAERKKIQQQKEDLKQLTYDIISMIKTEMEADFIAYGSNVAIQYYSVENKNNMLENILNNYKENTQYGEKIKYKREIMEIFNKNYYKILTELEKIYKKNDQYIFSLQYEEAEKEIQEEIRQENKINKINTFFKIFFAIVFFPIFLVILLIYAGIKAAN